MVDPMNFYFESKNLAEINESNFITLYADEAENSSNKECFAMFVTYYSNKAQKVVTSFLGILDLKGKTAAEIMDVIKNFFWQNLQSDCNGTRTHNHLVCKRTPFSQNVSSSPVAVT